MATLVRKFNDLTLDVSDYAHNLNMKSHAHEPAAFSFVLRGSYDETIGRKHTRTCKENALLFHPSDEIHSVKFHNVATRIFRLTVNSSWLGRLEKSSFELSQPMEFQNEKIASLAKKMYAEMYAPDRFSEFAIEGLALELFAAVARNSLGNKKENKTPRWLECVREMLHENYADDETSLQSLAETAGVHPVYLARQFRKFYQTTVGDYVRQLRIKKAAGQLSNTRQSISEIALATGFYDQSHFSNVFKKHTGMTPAEFRLNKRDS